MPPITTDHGVLDWSLTVYGTISVLVALSIFAGGTAWLRARRAKARQMDIITKDALKHLEPFIRALYQHTEPHPNPDRYGVWREEYINRSGRRYGKHVWQASARTGELPPVVAPSELTH